MSSSMPFQRDIITVLEPLPLPKVAGAAPNWWRATRATGCLDWIGGGLGSAKVADRGGARTPGVLIAGLQQNHGRLLETKVPCS